MSQATIRKRICLLTRVQRALKSRLTSISVELAKLSAELKEIQIKEFEVAGKITHLTMAGTVRKSRPTSDPDAIYIQHFKSLNPEDQQALLARLTGRTL